MNTSQIDLVILSVVGEHWTKVAMVILRVVNATGHDLPPGDEGYEVIPEGVSKMKSGSHRKLKKGTFALAYPLSRQLAFGIGEEPAKLPSLHNFGASHTGTLRITHSSPNQLQRKLNLSRWGLRRRDQPGVANRTSRRIKDIPVIERWREIRVVNNIEKLRTKLHVERIRNFFDVIILEEREVKIQQSRTNDGVPAEISSQVKAQ